MSFILQFNAPYSKIEFISKHLKELVDNPPDENETDKTVEKLNSILKEQLPQLIEDIARHPDHRKLWRNICSNLRKLDIHEFKKIQGVIGRLTHIGFALSDPDKAIKTLGSDLRQYASSLKKERDIEENLKFAGLTLNNYFKLFRGTTVSGTPLTEEQQYKLINCLNDFKRDLNDITAKFPEITSQPLFKNLHDLVYPLGDKDFLSFNEQEFSDAELSIIVSKLVKNDFRFKFQEYGIKYQNTKIRLAKLAAQQNGEGTSKYIQNFGINDQRALIEIAKLAAQQAGWGTSEYIQNYRIKSQSALIDIAKLAAQQDGWGTSNCIKNYGIKDRGALIDIAKLSAQQNGRSSLYIKNYGIKDERALIEIATLAAQQDAEGFSKYVQNYGIKDQSALVKIAQLAIQNDVFKTSLYIHNYRIKDQSGLIKIAELAARQSGLATSGYIKNYGIKDERALIEIAKLAAQQHGHGTSKYIENYGIKDKRALFEIAKLSAQQNGLETIKCLDNYDLKKGTNRFEILLLAFKNNPKDCLKAILNKYLTENSTLDNLQKAFCYPEEFSPIFKELSQKAPKKEDIYFLCYLGLSLYLLNKSPFLKDPNIWVSILQYKDQKMRYELADLLFALDESQAKLYKHASLPTYLQLPSLFFCFSSQNDTDIKSYHDIIKDRREFRDGMMLKALLDALHPLIVGHHFKVEEITNLLKTAFTGNIKANLLAIQGILYCGGEDRLRKEAQSASPNLDAAYRAAFARAIPIKPVKDLLKKYAQTFGRCPLPTAPLTYAGRLRRLPLNEQEKALPDLGSFIYSVLEGGYPEIRYQRKEGSHKESDSKVFAYLDHLQMIFDKKPSLKKEWRAEIEKPLEDYLPTSSSKAAFDPQRFLIDKILSDKDFPKEKYPLLYHFLETKDQKIAKDLGEDLEKLTASNKERKGQTVILRNAISILGDIEKKNAKDKTVKLLDCLIKAKEQLKGLPGIAASLSGIEELTKLLKAKKQPKKMPEGTLTPAGIEETDFTAQEHAKSVQMFVDQFKKAAEETRSRLGAVDEENQRLLLQKDLIDLYRSEKATLSQQLGQLNKILVKLSKSGDKFLNDVKGVIETLGKQKQSFDGYTLVNTDRFDFMLLCGQLPGSCQRIDGDPSLNKCLLAYLLDGKNRLIAIKDKAGPFPEGNIVARSILRLLWDTKSNRPVLMQEMVYSNVADDSLKAALNKFAKAESERLGVALYRKDDAGTASLQSFGSIAPWEYVDSANGVNANGKFTITKASEVVA